MCRWQVTAGVSDRFVFLILLHTAANRSGWFWLVTPSEARVTSEYFLQRASCAIVLYFHFSQFYINRNITQWDEMSIILVTMMKSCRNKRFLSGQFFISFQELFLNIIRVTYRGILAAFPRADQGLPPVEAEVYIAVNLCSDSICSLGYEVPGHGPPDINCRCYCLQRSQIPTVSPYSPPCLVCLHRSRLRNSLIDRMEWREEDRGIYVCKRRVDSAGIKSRETS